MPELLHILYLSIAALVTSTALLACLGHRVKWTDWPTSLGYLALVLLASRELLDAGFGIRVEDPALAVSFLPGIAVIALARRWNAVGQACFSSVLSCTCGYLAYAAWITFTSSLDALSLAFSLLLLGLITAVLFLMIAHAFEVIDVLCRVVWRRRLTPRPTTDWFPKVSLHVPACNEPPEMVIETLNALARLDYPDYEVIVIDDNTSDPRMWRPVQEHCRTLGFRFFHLEDWPGFKSGALNYALGQAAPDAEIVGVVDSDYIVEPDYLKDLVGFFRNRNVAFVQTPQDYRDFDRNDTWSLALYHSYQYFFKLSMASRNERNGIIFTGTMGLIRRDILERVGGWDEWCITEDAEVSLKILSLGYESVYIDRTYGRGLMPLDFEGLRRQRFRWAFGGMQVVRMHWRKLLPSLTPMANRENRLSFGQKFDYWSGALQWLNDPLTSLFTALLFLSAVSFALAGSAFLPPIAGTVTFVPFVFIVFGMLKMLWALRLRLQCSLREAHRAFLVLLSLTWVVTMACAQGLTRREGVFLRTPKYKGARTMINSMRTVGKESLLALLGLATALLVQWRAPAGQTALLLSGLLLWQGYVYGAAFVVNRWSLAGARAGARIPLPEPLPRAAETRTMTGAGRRLGIVVLGGAIGLSAWYPSSTELAPEITSGTDTRIRGDPPREFVRLGPLHAPVEQSTGAMIFLRDDPEPEPAPASWSVETAWRTHWH